jgi:ferric-dicitrate binding protein FerR (iron transport regulator)
MNYFDKEFLKRLNEGTLSDKEHERFQQWLSEIDNTLQQAFLDRFESFQLHNPKFAHIRQPETPKFSRSLRSFVPLKVAAFLILTILSGLLIWDLQNPRASVKFYSGLDYSEVILPDSTMIKLEPDSRIGVKYDESTRNIDLEGKAYFHVTRNENRPMIIKTEGIETRVLGTIFQICQSSKGVQVALHEGSVAIQYNKQEQLLKPQEQWIWNRKTDKSEIFEFIEEDIREIRFENEQLSTVLTYLEWKHSVEVNFNEQDLRDCSISITIGNFSMNDAMELISFASGLEYEVSKGNKYQIKGNCN